jgi:hypothetical protein
MFSVKSKSQQFLNNSISSTFTYTATSNVAFHVVRYGGGADVRCKPSPSSAVINNSWLLTDMPSFYFLMPAGAVLSIIPFNTPFLFDYYIFEVP